MRNDIYARSNTPVGFHDDKVIYDLYGRAVGQLRGSHVYCMAGHYVGELRDGILCGKHRSYRKIPAGLASPGRRAPRDTKHTGNRLRKKA